MTFVYDVLLNFQKDFFDFFEWNSNDNIVHIKKIPLIKVCNNDYNMFKNSLVCFNKDFISSFFNKTETVSLPKKHIPYAFLVSNGCETIALKLNRKGFNEYKSSLLFDEDDEVSNIAFSLAETKPKYVIKKKCEVCSFKTRNEKNAEKYIIHNINLLYKNHEFDKLKYIYLDCFNVKENDIKKICAVLKKVITNESQYVLKLNDFFKIIEKKRG